MATNEQATRYRNNRRLRMQARRDRLIPNKKVIAQPWSYYPYAYGTIVAVEKDISSGHSYLVLVRMDSGITFSFPENHIELLEDIECDED